MTSPPIPTKEKSASDLKSKATSCILLGGFGLFFSWLFLPQQLPEDIMRYRETHLFLGIFQFVTLLLLIWGFVLRSRTEKNKERIEPTNINTESNTKKHFPHLIHLVLTLLTGIWLLVWILHYIFRDRKKYN